MAHTAAMFSDLSNQIREGLVGYPSYSVTVTVADPTPERIRELSDGLRKYLPDVKVVHVSGSVTAR